MSESSNEPSNSQADTLTKPRLSKSDIFEILQSDRRRHILETLRTEGSMSISSLVETIALMEAENNELTIDGRKGVYDSLLNNHIPKMESLSIITYEREKDLVRLLPEAKMFNTYIETTKKGDIPWSQFFFGFSTLALVVSILIYTGLLKWVTSSQWLIFMLAIFFISSIVYHRHVTKL